MNCRLALKFLLSHNSRLQIPVEESFVLGYIGPPEVGADTLSVWEAGILP